MIKKNSIKLVLIFLLALIVRCWRVGSYPPLLWDEAALGYNAYSILKTGRDEYGHRFPLIFKSFGDYKPGFYLYLSLPFIALLGLNELAIRLPSVIFGALTPIFLYFLVKNLFQKPRLALWSSLVLALLPWQIHFSRGAWEVNLMTSFLVLASWLWFQTKNLPLGLAFLAFSLGIYQGAKLLVPLIGFGWLIFSWPERKKIKLNLNPGSYFLSGLILFLILIWYGLSFVGPAKNRLKVMSLFTYPRPEREVKEILKEDGLTKKNWHFYLFHHQSFYFLRGFLTRYFNHFSPRFLAFDGDWTNPRHSAPYFGVIGRVNFVLFLLGLITFLSQKHPFSAYFLFYWLLLAPLPAALSRDIITGVRSFSLVIPLAVFIAWGIEKILGWQQLIQIKSFLGKKILFYSFVLALLGFYLLDFVYWWDLYSVHMVKKSPKDWLFGYKEVIEYLTQRETEFDQILVTDFYGQPYIYYLFYRQYPPRQYQKQAQLIENQFGDVGRVEKIDKIIFGPIDKAKAENCSHCLVIFAEDELLRTGLYHQQQFFTQLKPLGRINQSALFYAYEKK